MSSSAADDWRGWGCLVPVVCRLSWRATLGTLSGRTGLPGVTLGLTVSAAVCPAGGGLDLAAWPTRGLVPEEYEGICKLPCRQGGAQDRDKKLAEVYEQIETDLVLLGATAVEDRVVKTPRACSQTP